MFKRSVGSRWGVVAICALTGGGIACSSSNSGGGFPTSDEDGGTSGNGSGGNGNTNGSNGTSSGYSSSGTTSGAATTSGGNTTTSGGNTASSGATTGTSSGAATCSTTSTGGLMLTAGYQMGVGTGGYAFAYMDAGGSTACVGMASLCGSGSTVAQNATYSNWGAGIGMNVSQMMDSMTMGTYAVPSTSTGLTYTLSSLPAAGRLIITNGTLTNGMDDYCYDLTAASATIPWAMFNSKCYDTPPDGTALSGPPQMLLQVKVQTGGLATAGTFDFCIDSIKF